MVAVRLAVLGGLTSASEYIINDALYTGYEVSILVESTDRFFARHDEVSLTRGSVHALNDTERALQDVHAVIAILDHLDQELTAMAVQNIILAMKTNALDRLMLSLGNSVTSSCGDVIRHSGLDWTIVRPLAISAKARQQLGVHYQQQEPSILVKAKFMLSELTSSTYIHKVIALSV